MNLKVPSPLGQTPFIKTETISSNAYYILPSPTSSNRQTTALNPKLLTMNPKP